MNESETKTVSLEEVLKLTQAAWTSRTQAENQKNSLMTKKSKFMESMGDIDQEIKLSELHMEESTETLIKALNATVMVMGNEIIRLTQRVETLESSNNCENRCSGDCESCDGLCDEDCANCTCDGDCNDCVDEQYAVDDEIPSSYEQPTSCPQDDLDKEAAESM